MPENNTKAISDQHNSYYFAKFGDASDLTDCSRFAQGFVAADILKLTLKENSYLLVMNQAQGKFLGSGIRSLYNKAFGNMIEGVAEGAGGLGQGAAGAFQAEKSVENAGKISAQQAKFQQDLTDFEEHNNPTTGIRKSNNQTATNAAEQKAKDLQVTLEKAEAGDVTVRLESQPVAQQEIQPKTPQTQTPAATSSSQQQIAELRATTTLHNAPANGVLQENATNADVTKTAENMQSVEIGLQAEETESYKTPTHTVPTPAQSNSENSELPKSSNTKGTPKLGPDSSKLKDSDVFIPGSEDTIRVKHEGELKRLDQENQKSNNIGTVLQGASQLSQTGAQGSRMYQQEQDATKGAFDQDYNTLGSAGKTIEDTVGKLNQINPFQQNTTNR